MDMETKKYIDKGILIDNDLENRTSEDSLKEARYVLPKENKINSQSHCIFENLMTSQEYTDLSNEYTKDIDAQANKFLRISRQYSKTLEELNKYNTSPKKDLLFFYDHYDELSDDVKKLYDNVNELNRELVSINSTIEDMIDTQYNKYVLDKTNSSDTVEVTNDNVFKVFVDCIKNRSDEEIIELGKVKAEEDRTVNDCGAMFCLKDGTIISVHNSYGCAMHIEFMAKLAEEVLTSVYKGRLKLSEINETNADRILYYMTYTRDWIRFNSKTWCESRFYCVLSDRLTQAQYDKLLKFLILGEQMNTETVDVYVSESIEYHHYLYSVSTPEDIVMSIKRYYTSGYLLENSDKSATTTDSVINEKIEKHDSLNNKLWNDDNTLKDEVREKIIAIAKEFTDGLAQDGIKFNLKDIRIVGSNCSYNYTEDSDLDVHLIMDTSTLKCPDELYPLLYSSYRSLFNGRLDIDFYGIPVELYVEEDNSSFAE